MVVTSSTLEIGRGHYQHRRKDGFDIPITAEAMCAINRRHTSLQTRERILEYGEDRWQEKAVAAFQQFIDDTQHKKTIGLIDHWNQFYWEHRMSTWHGVLSLERAFYGYPFVPFNVRDIFEAMLGVSWEERDSAVVFTGMIDKAEPLLRHLPINPRVWPPVRTKPATQADTKS